MKTLRKIIPLLTLVGGLTTACSSYSSKPGKLKNLVGTYELDVYKMKVDDNNPEEEAYDHKAKIGCVAYLSIDEEGYGYYGYKDNETPARIDSVFSVFHYDEEKPELIKSITMSDGKTQVYADEQKVGCMDESQMGFRDELFKKQLNYTLHSGHMMFQPERKIKYQHVEYKRVSKEASLAKVNELLGTSATFNKPYEMKRCEGFYAYSCYYKDGMGYEKYGDYDYAVLDFESYSEGKIDLTYALKSDHERHTEKVQVSILEKGKSFTASIFGRTFTCDGAYNDLGRWLNGNNDQYTSDTEKLAGESFAPYSGEAKTLDEVIADLTKPEEVL